MKTKIITLAYIILIGTSSFADDIFLSGGFSLLPKAQITSFYSREIKLQPKIDAEAFFYLNYADYFTTGFSAGIIYALPSGLDGGWSYPGFSGIETGFEIGMIMPFWEVLSIQGSLDAGWYRYNLTENMFFLPSASLGPNFRIFYNEQSDIYIDLPVRYYFHKQADIFMSVGLGCKVVLK